MAGCARILQALGVYVVGAIDPAERVLVERHVALCLGCRAELAGLAGIPALLGRVTLDELERQPAPVPPGGPPFLWCSRASGRGTERPSRCRRTLPARR
jgi:Putative zinc-finger